MEYMFDDGFLGTGAPFFMDIVTLLVALLPLFVYSAILLAKRKFYKMHAMVQNGIYLLSIVVIGYFEAGVRYGGGFDTFVLGSGVSHIYLSVVMIIHIIIATVTLFYWTLTIFKANKSFREKRLPGTASKEHLRVALKSFVGITFTAFSGIWVYLLLFVY
jgi:putative membrane protein